MWLVEHILKNVVGIVQAIIATIQDGDAYDQMLEHRGQYLFREIVGEGPAVGLPGWSLYCYRCRTFHSLSSPCAAGRATDPSVSVMLGQSHGAERSRTNSVVIEQTQTFGVDAHIQRQDTC